MLRQQFADFATVAEQHSSAWTSNRQALATQKPPVNHTAKEKLNSQANARPMTPLANALSRVSRPQTKSGLGQKELDGFSTRNKVPRTPISLSLQTVPEDMRLARSVFDKRFALIAIQSLFLTHRK